MADEAKKTRAPRRSKTDIIQGKLDKAFEQKAKYTQKLADLDKTIKELQEDLEKSKLSLLTESLEENHLSVDEAIDALNKAGQAKAASTATTEA